MTTPRPSPPEKRGLRGLQCRRATLGVLTSAAVGRTTPGGPSGDPRGLGQRPRARGPRGRVYRAGLAGRGLHTAARTLLRVAASEVQEGGAGPNWICSFRGPGEGLRPPAPPTPPRSASPTDAEAPRPLAPNWVKPGRQSARIFCRRLLRTSLQLLPESQASPFFLRHLTIFCH